MNMTKPPPPREAIRREQSFPLIAFFQLCTYCVALVTCIDFKELSKQMRRIPSTDFIDVLMPILLATTLGFCIGSAVGLGQIRKWRSFFFCGVTGAIVGLAILATCAAPARLTQALAACLLPLVSTFILRFRTR